MHEGREGALPRCAPTVPKERSHPCVRETFENYTEYARWFLGVDRHYYTRIMIHLDLYVFAAQKLDGDCAS